MRRTRLQSLAASKWSQARASHCTLCTARNCAACSRSILPALEEAAAGALQSLSESGAFICMSAPVCRDTPNILAMSFSTPCHAQEVICQHEFANLELTGQCLLVALQWVWDALQDLKNEGFAAVSYDAADLEPATTPVSKSTSTDILVRICFETIICSR